MGQNAGCLGLALVTLLAASRTPQAADQFTPVVVSPVTNKIGPVLGTDGKHHVVYEVACTNTRPVTATLQKIAVVDASDPSRVIAAYDDGPLLSRLRTLGNSAPGAPEIEFNGTRLVLIHLAFDSGAAVPRRLAHHIELLGASPDPKELTPIATSYTVAPLDLAPLGLVIGPPLAGPGWVALNGCCEAAGVHRGTALPINGQLYFAQRFAIDWMRLDDRGRLVHGDPADVHSYTGYGADVLAVADGTVVAMRQNLDDQTPPNLPDPKTIDIESVDGNHVVLALGNGVFANYAHLQKDSLRVQVGDRVRRGQVLGRLGNSGNSSAPHLHFHIMDGLSVLGSDGLPYVIDRFDLAGQIPGTRSDELDGDFGAFLFRQPLARGQQYPLDLAVVHFTQ